MAVQSEQMSGPDVFQGDCIRLIMRNEVPDIGQGPGILVAFHRFDAPIHQDVLPLHKPQNCSYLWKSDRYPANTRHMGEHIKKWRFDLKMNAVECQKLTGVDKYILRKWQSGRHEPRRQAREVIVRFLG